MKYPEVAGLAPAPAGLSAKSLLSLPSPPFVGANRRLAGYSIKERPVFKTFGL